MEWGGRRGSRRGGCLQITEISIHLCLPMTVATPSKAWFLAVHLWRLRVRIPPWA